MPRRKLRSFALDGLLYKCIIYTMYEAGLTLGKYAPFHRGHRHLIETALAECRRVFVIVYPATRYTDIPLGVRAGWIRELCPRAEVLEAPDGPEDTGDAPEIERLQEAFLLRFLAGRRVDAFYSSEPYGGHVSRALGCADRRVDEARLAWPVSGSALRADAALRERFLDPPVRADLVRRHILLGGPSTGKTTLAAALSERLGEPWCPEYGREYWFERQVDHRLTMEDLETIAREQAALERRTAFAAKRLLLADTCPLTTLAYARYYYGRVSPALERTVDDYLRLPRSYWLCGDDIPFEDTPDRSGPPSRAALQALNAEELDARGLSYRILRGPLERRVDTLYSYEKARGGPS
jgi:HTH-type transcriptional regulator, transcriptional repressor of NAD biosynthesis genes